MSPEEKEEVGAVTAEVATALPALLLCTLALCGLVGAGLAQARAVDAAREAARVAARGEPDAGAVRLAERVAVTGSRVVLRREGDSVTVTVTSRLRVPTTGGSWSLGEVHADAVAAVEPTG